MSLKSTDLVESMTPQEYAIFHVIGSLRAKGEREVTFSRIHEELNRRRMKEERTTFDLQPKQISKQAMNHHLAKLSKKPFMLKQSKRKNTFYSLKPGLYKLNQTPPLCLSIVMDKTTVMICSLIQQCKLQPLSPNCLKKLSPAKQA